MVVAGEGKRIAAAWVTDFAARTPELMGAFFHGSTVELADDVTLPPTSDLDVMLVHSTPEPPVKPGKFERDGVLIEGSWIARDAVSSAERVLGEYNLAGSFRRDGIILDPSGHLTAVQRVVGEEFAWRSWVEVRAAQARDKVIGGFRLREDASLPENVISWIFPAGVTTHVLLVAGLRNPTVRRRYEASRQLLDDYGMLPFQETLLDLIGARDLTPGQVEAHLRALGDVFDSAARYARTPYPFLSDIAPDARAVAIDGSQSLIDRGLHREAVFWIVVTFARSLMLLDADAPPALAVAAREPFQALLRDLGITGWPDLVRRHGETITAVPAVWAAAAAIIDANPEIVPTP